MSENIPNKTNRKFLWLLLTFLLLIAVVLFVLKENKFVSITNSTQISQKTQESDTLDGIQDTMRAVLNKTTVNEETEHHEQELRDLKSAYVLTKLAAERLQYARDIPTALQLLQQAQEDLSHSKDPNLIKVQGMLAVDYQKIAALNSVDKTRVSSQLDSLDQLIDVLPVQSNTPKAASKTVVSTADASEKTNTKKTWQQKAQQFFDDVKSSVKVRKKSDVDRDLSFVNLEYKRARFSLIIEQIRWATYYGDQAVFQNSINEAQDLLTKVFDPNDANVQKFANILDELAVMNVRPDIPSIQDTVNALQALIIG